MFSKAVPISALLSIVAAQSIPNISSQCTQALTQIATNSDVAQCLTPSPLLSLFTGLSSSIITPIDSWVTSVCAAGTCSNSTIAAIVTNATAGCSTELAALGFQSGDNSAVIAAIQQYYPAVRQIVCLKDGSTNCVTETLTGIQNVVGPLSLSNIPQIITGGFNSSTIPQNVTCSNCSKAAYNIAQQAAPGLISAQSAQQQCGSSFTDGQNPSGITETASNASASSSSGNNGAVNLAATPGVSVLFALLGAFTILA